MNHHALPAIAHQFTIILITCVVMLCSASTGLAAGEHHGRHDVGNPDNPYDDMGRLHNETLDYVIEARKVVGDRPAPLTTAIIGRTLEFTRDALHGPCGATVVDFDRIARVVSQPEVSFEELAKSMPAEQFAFARRIEDLARRMARDPSAVDELRKLEKEISTTLTRPDARPLLMSAAVARFSAEYWIDQVERADTSPWLRGRGGAAGGGILPTDDWIVADWLGALKGAHYAREHGLPEAEAAALGAALASSVVLIHHVYD